MINRKRKDHSITTQQRR